MKLSKVRVGEKFVLDDRGGVWEKIAEGKARCFFGSRDMWNKEIDFEQDVYCYVIFEGRPKPFGKDAGKWEGPVEAPASSVIGGTRVRIVDEGEDCLVKEIEQATPSQINMLATSEALRFIPDGKSALCEYQVSERKTDMDDNTYYVFVIPQEKDNARND